ncbi:uncharacterized protein LOC108675850 [Hyalella azteca]|uniref:Uncharacterized protein LOC108675850 n=1 Tax=Hyalella azteca TaxID=294128 RepID=A0A8B7P2X5_HYAAZ|nr:uncharacterized protein LOC108675850 [Hyalella azteca]
MPSKSDREGEVRCTEVGVNGGRVDADRGGGGGGGGEGSGGDGGGQVMPGLPLHWYDEPPYESDPEDFLFGSSDCHSGEDESSRSLRDSLREEDVISLRTAGDICLPRTAPECVPLLDGSAAYLARDGPPISYYQQTPCHFKVYDGRALDHAYRQHQECETYREHWSGNGSLRDPRTKSKADKRDKDKFHKIDKENDKYYCKNTSKKSNNKHRSVRGLSSRSSRPAGSPPGSVCSSAPVQLLSQLSQQPVYDNISGVCISRPSMPIHTSSRGGTVLTSSSCNAAANLHQYVNGTNWSSHGQPVLPHYRPFPPTQQQALHYQSQYYCPTQSGSSNNRSVMNGTTYSTGDQQVPAAPSRHNLQLRGLSSSQSHYLHMQGQHAPSDPAMVASTSPDYELRWDLHNVTAASGPTRLSSASVENHRSDPSGLCLSNLMSRGSISGGSDDGHSAAPSSDCEDGEKSDSASLINRFRGLHKDMLHKIAKVKSPRGAPSTGDDLQVDGRVADGRCHAPCSSDADGVTLRKRANSESGPQSPPSPAPYTGPFIGRAVALTDFQPSPYDVDLLKLNKGDVIDIISKSPSGQWRGCVDGRVGNFKFIFVEEETERDRLHRKLRGQRSSPLEQFPHASLEALLRHYKLGHLLQLFILHGYETLDQLRELEEQDLDSLGIRDTDTRATLLAAVTSILEYEQTSIVCHVSEASVTNNTSSSSRDSGFMDHKTLNAGLIPEVEYGNADGRQSSPSTDNSSGYQSRGNYNIAHPGDVSSTLQEVPDTTLDSTSSTEEDLTSKEFKKNNIARAPSDLDTREPDSYRATPVLVRPGTPDSSPRLRKKVTDDRDGDASARCSSDTGVSLHSDAGQ